MVGGRVVILLLLLLCEQGLELFDSLLITQPKNSCSQKKLRLRAYETAGNILSRKIIICHKRLNGKVTKLYWN